MGRKSDLIMLSEQYAKVYENTNNVPKVPEGDASAINFDGILKIQPDGTREGEPKRDENAENIAERKWDFDDVINVENTPFYVKADYEARHKYDDGDRKFTPSTSWVEVDIDERDLEVYKENPETGDFDIPVDREKEKDLYEKIFGALYEKIKDFETGRL